MRSSKSRSRSKSNRNNNRSVGNIVNRVFDSNGPEGKVRGTPQQIIDKYNQLARDAQLGNDRVATENFQQHAEHYLRMLSEAQREQDARREEQERQNRERQAERDRERAARQDRESETGAKADDKPEAQQPVAAAGGQADVVDLGGDDDSGLVETPENQAESKPVVDDAPKADKSDNGEEKPKPKRTRTSTPRKPRAKKTTDKDADKEPAAEPEPPQTPEAAE